MVQSKAGKRAEVVFGKANRIAVCLAASVLMAGAAASAQSKADALKAPATAVPSQPKSQVPVAQTPVARLSTEVPGPEHEEAKRKPDDAAHQGIAVHGHWQIDVRNPDGTLAKQYDFQNSSADKGLDIAYILTGRFTAGEWAIRSLGTGCTTTGTSGECLLTQYANGMVRRIYGAACTNGSTSCVTALNVSVGTGASNSGPYTIILTGQMTAVGTGTLTNVNTLLVNCANSGATYATVTPAQCGIRDGQPSDTIFGTDSGGFIPFFTGTAITPVAVTAGQTIAFTVTLSFS